MNNRFAKSNIANIRELLNLYHYVASMCKVCIHICQRYIIFLVQGMYTYMSAVYNDILVIESYRNIISNILRRITSRL